MGEEKIYFRSTLEERGNERNLLILHDLLDHHGRYDELAQYARASGDFPYQVFWMDFKGHGLSSGVRGHVENFDEYCWDVLEMLEIIKKNQRPIVVLGQGLGALVILKMLNPTSQFAESFQEGIEGLILVNPILHFNFEWPDFKVGLLKKMIPTVNRLKVPVRIKGHQLCTDPIKADLFDRDPLVLSKLSLGLLGEVIQAGVDVRRMSYFIDLPTLFLVSQNDFLISSEQIYLYQKGLPKDLSCYYDYPHARHDLLNDKNREIVFNDIIDWLNQRGLS